MARGITPASVIDERQLYGWRHRVRDIDEEMRTLSAEREKLTGLIAMAEQLMQQAALLAAASDAGASHPKLITKALGGLTPTDNFPKAVSMIVARSEDGVTYDELREAILLSPLSDRFRKSDKGFYHALGRAKNRGEFVEYKGYVFTPENLAAFQRKVAAGIKQDKVASTSSRSPLHDAILETVAKNPGIVAKEVVERLRGGSEEHGLAPLKNDGSAFNAIARLKNRDQQLEAFGDQGRQLRIGPNAPEDIKRLARSGIVIPMAKRTEAPSGRAAGASEAGQGGNPDLFSNPAATRR